MKVALITGITGQDGSYLAEFLLKKNYIIHGVKRRSSSSNTERIDHLHDSINFSNKNLNWFGKPYGHLITNFLDYEYDILIDLSLKNHYPLNYLLKASTAKFKIGASKKDITIFDQEINSDEISNLSVLITKITDYLTQVK